MLTGFVLVYSEDIKLVSIIRFIFFSKCKTKYWQEWVLLCFVASVEKN